MRSGHLDRCLRPGGATRASTRTPPDQPGGIRRPSQRIHSNRQTASTIAAPRPARKVCSGRAAVAATWARSAAGSYSGATGTPIMENRDGTRGMMLETGERRSRAAASAGRGRGSRAGRPWCFAALLALLLSPALGIADDTAERLRDARRALQQGRYDEAMKAFRELERRRADTAAVAVGESQCHDARGEWKPAIELLAAAVKRSPRSVPLWATLAR